MWFEKQGDFQDLGHSNFLTDCEFQYNGIELCIARTSELFLFCTFPARGALLCASPQMLTAFPALRPWFPC